MKAALDLLIGLIVLAFAILAVILPGKARRRNLGVNEAYPMFQFLYPALFLIICLQQLLDYNRNRNRYVDGFLVACCVISAVLPIWTASRHRERQMWNRSRIAVSALYGVVAIVFIILTFR